MPSQGFQLPGGLSKYEAILGYLYAVFSSSSHYLLYPAHRSREPGRQLLAGLLHPMTYIDQSVQLTSEHCGTAAVEGPVLLCAVVVFSFMLGRHVTTTHSVLRKVAVHSSPRHCLPSCTKLSVPMPESDLRTLIPALCQNMSWSDLRLASTSCGSSTCIKKFTRRGNGQTEDTVGLSNPSEIPCLLRRPI